MSLCIHMCIYVYIVFISKMYLHISNIYNTIYIIYNISYIIYLYYILI